MATAAPKGTGADTYEEAIALAERAASQARKAAKDWEALAEADEARITRLREELARLNPAK